MSPDEVVPVPKQFTCDGNDAPPTLTVSGPPDGVRSFAVIMDDPDAPKGTFTHWLAYDIPVSRGNLEVDAGKSLRNSFGREGYGDRVHRPAALESAVTTRQDLESALELHALAHAELMGRYERKR